MTRHSAHPPVDRRAVLRATGGLTALSIAGCLGEENASGDGDAGDEGPSGSPDDGADVEYAVGRVAEGFENPWGLAFLPADGRLLVTERPGRLSILDPADGTRTAVEGVPDVHAAGQGGLLDVAVHPAFPDDARVYLTYAATNDAGAAATHVGSGRLSLDAGAGAPSFDGFEAIRSIRETPSMAQIRVIAISASVAESIRAECLRMGFDEFLPKPFRQLELLDLTRELLAVSWVHESGAAPAESAAGEEAAPPEYLLERVEAHVAAGNIREILKATDSIREAGEQYAPVANRIESLAQEFQINRLAAYINRLRSAKVADDG